MRIIVFLSIFTYSSFLFANILVNLNKTDLKSPKLNFYKIVKSEKEYNTALKFYNKNIEKLKKLKIDLDAVTYSIYKPSEEAKNIHYIKLMHYMKLLTMDILENLKKKDEYNTLKSLKYQLKFFKIIYKTNTLISHMVVVANEKTLFTFIDQKLKTNLTENAKSLIEEYYKVRKDQIIKTINGEFEFMNTLLLSELSSKEYSPFLGLEERKKIVAYISKKSMPVSKYIINGLKNSKNDDYFSKFSKDKVQENFSLRVVKAYIIIALSYIYRDLNKPYQFPNIYLELIGDILLNIGSPDPKIYNLYAKKDKEVLGIMESLIIR